MDRVLGILVGFLALGGLAPLTAAGAKPLPACGASEVASFLGAGNANLEGQVVLGTAGAGGTPGSRVQVELLPAIPCVEAWWALPASHHIQKGFVETTYPDDARFLSVVRVANADLKGSFAFYQIPPGRYLLRTPWLVVRPGAYTAAAEGTYLLETVVLEAGGTAHVTLRGPNANQ